MGMVCLVIVSVVFVLITLGCSNSTQQTSIPFKKPSFWQDGFCRQRSVDTSQLKEGLIRAVVDGVWQEYRLTSLPDGFIKWALAKRSSSPHKNPNAFLAGHCGLVATYGCPRSDSRFHINNAAKGLGFLPKPDKIAEINRTIENAFQKPLTERLALLKKLYKDFDSYFSRTSLVSLELYTRPDFETQTFINQMTNPACSIVFLDMTSYELKAIAQILHPADPQLTDYEKEVVRFANLMHDFGHGAKKRPKHRFITVVYHLIEVYDNSPRPGKQGRKLTQ